MKLTKPLHNCIYISISIILCALLSIKALYLKEVTVVSVICYAVLTLISTMAAIFIKDYKSDDSIVLEILQAVAIPGFLFTLYSMLIDKRVIYISIIIILGGTIAYTAALIKINIIDSGRSYRSQYTKKIIAIGLYNARAFFMTLLGVLAIAGSIILASNFLYEKRIERQYASEKIFQEQDLVEWSESRTLRANYDDVAPLASNEQFEKVKDVNERIALFERAVDIEANYLCIPKKIFVTTGNLDEGISANYSIPKNTIVIDKEYLSTCSRDDLLRTCIHECTHALQAEKLQLYRELKDNKKAMILLADYFGNIDKYEEELSSYKSEGDEYYNQTVELEAVNNSKKELFEWNKAFIEIEFERRAEGKDS